MKTKPANYTTQEAIAQKLWVGLLSFAGITRRYSSKSFANINGTNDKKFMKSLSIRYPDIDLIKRPVGDAMQINAEILDKDTDATTVLKDNSMVGKASTLKIGFQELNDSDFVSYPTQKIQKVSHSNLSWAFNSRDAGALFNKKLFRKAPSSPLNGAINSSTGTITVEARASRQRICWQRRSRPAC